MEKDIMEKGKNLMMMMDYFMKENIYMEKEMEMEKNIMKMANYIMKEIDYLNGKRNGKNKE